MTWFGKRETCAVVFSHHLSTQWDLWQIWYSPNPYYGTKFSFSLKLCVCNSKNLYTIVNLTFLQGAASGLSVQKVNSSRNTLSWLDSSVHTSADFLKRKKKVGYSVRFRTHHGMINEMEHICKDKQHFLSKPN